MLRLARLVSLLAPFTLACEPPERIGVGLGSTGYGAIVYSSSSNLYHVVYSNGALTEPTSMESLTGASYYPRVGANPLEPSQGVTVWQQAGPGSVAEDVWVSRLGL